VTYFDMGFPKKEILMDYVSRSCDLGWLGGGTSKKGNFDGLCKQFFNPKIPKNPKNVIK
jgi:hypothetical protein